MTCNRMTRRSFAFGLLLVCFPLLSHAKGDRKPFQIYDFSKGVDTYHDSKTLPDGYVQDSLNGLFDDQAPFTKRFGYATSWSTKAYSYTGLWTYTDASNTTWQIARSSDQLTANDLAGHIVKIATVSVNNLVGETNAFGNAYFVDQTQGVYYWNSSSTTFITGSPKGSVLAQFHNRLWVIGAAVPNGNQLYGSAYYNGSSWATGLNATDPVQYSVGLQDNFDNLTAEYVYLDTLYLFKHYAVYSLYGFDQTNFQISQLTQECGCIDGGTIQTYNGGLKFVSLRGVEDFNGYACKRISDSVKNKIDPAIQLGSFSQQSWVQSSQSDWQTGTIGNLDALTYTPLLALVNKSTSVPNNSFENDFSSWPVHSGWTIATSTQNALATGSCAQNILTAYNGTKFAVNTTTIFNHPNVSFRVILASAPSVIVSSTGFHPNTAVCSWTAKTVPYSLLAGTSIQISLVDLDAGNTLTSNPFFASGNQTATFYFADLGMTQTYVDFLDGQIALVTNYSSGTFRSQIHNFGTISSWGNFNIQQTLNDGVIAYSICSSTNTAMSPNQSCTSQAINSQILLSTGVTGSSIYGQWYATFTVTAATQTPTLQSGTIQTFTGKLQIPMASTVWDNRYWLSLTTNTSNATNDTVLVLNSRGAWAPYDIHAGAFTQYKNSLYHADSLASGNIYLDNQAYTDNGVPINTYVRTKNQSLGGLASDDYLYALYPSAANTGSCPMSVQYTMDASTNTLSLGSPLLSEFGSASSVRLPFPVDSSHQNFGQSIDFTVGTNDASCAWRFLGLEGIARQRPVQ